MKDLVSLTLAPPDVLLAEEANGRQRVWYRAAVVGTVNSLGDLLESAHGAGLGRGPLRDSGDALPGLPEGAAPPGGEPP